MKTIRYIITRCAVLSFIILLMLPLLVVADRGLTANMKRGDKVVFGRYEQDDNLTNGPEALEWLVLDCSEGNALLISRYVIDQKPFNRMTETITWRDSSVRKWLNESFISEAFNEEEREKIRRIQLKNDESQSNPANPIDGGTETNDQVFLLSFYEARLYFADNVARQTIPTQYAIKNGVVPKAKNGMSFWWLRSPSKNLFNAAVVSDSGEIGSGSYVDRMYNGIRPAIWVRL